MRRGVLLVVVAALVAGCGPSGPPTTETTSAGFATLAEKVGFLEDYVRFRRNYEQLDFAIEYHNNSGGMVPGPSEWDVRIVAVVPPPELDAWTSALSPAASPDTALLAGVPTPIDHSGVTQWFRNGGVLVGVDEGNAVVVYRNLAM